MNTLVPNPTKRLSYLTRFALISAMAGLLAATGANAAEPSLKDAATPYFAIGTAVTGAQLKDPATSQLILQQFNCLTGEFEFMPQFLEPQPGKFTFERADVIAEFASANHLPLTGHMLCWGQLTPAWMYADVHGRPLPRETALANLKQYIDGVTAHFRGKVDSWNVVNEATSDDAGQWLRDTPAHRAIGDDYIEKAFEFAHQADPTVLLYYNDYNIEDPTKLARTLKLIARLQEQKVKLDAVGIQGHWLLDYPGTDTIDAAITALNKTGVKVMITELDIDVLPRKSGADLNARESAGANPYENGIPKEVLAQQASRYADIFRVLTRHHDQITRVTFWGVDDAQSWLNDFPVKGRKNYPLLFDRQLQPKPAFFAVLDAMQR